MSKIYSLKCPYCGAPINRSTMSCEYCGATFEESITPDVQILTVLENPIAKTYFSEVVIDRSSYDYFTEAQISGWVRDKLITALHNELSDNFEIESYYDPERGAYVSRGRVRIIPPGVKVR